MKISLVCEHYYPEIGGLERSTHRLAKHLTSAGWDINILAPWLKGCPEKEIWDGVRIVRPKGLGDKTFTDTPLAREVIRSSKAVCVFGIGDDRMDALWSPLFSEAKGRVYLKIGTEGDSVVKGVSQDTLRRFDGFFCQNVAIEDEVRALGVPRTHIHPVKNGINISKWISSMPKKSTARDILGIPSGYDLVFAAIGRFVKRKRFPDIIRAYTAAVGSIQSKSVLVLHGSDFGQTDGEESEIRQMLTGQKTVDIKIVSPSVDTAVTMSACDATVALGTREGAPNVVLESLISGKPIIASDISGHRVYVKDGIEGVLCSEGVNFQRELKDAFVTLANDMTRAKMSAQCLKRAHLFDIARTSRAYSKEFAR